MLSNVSSVHLVVSRHNRPRSRVPNRQLERKTIDLPQRTLRHDSIDLVPLMFLIVAYEMLQRRRNTLALKPIDKSAREDTRKNRILAIRLEAAASQRTSLDINCRPEQDVGAFCFCLFGGQLAGSEEEVFVESGA